ncbi:MAG: hypothetical protein JW929_13380 [Anaerolineales bacterium]|nr:hypothetical protein [Anaerolineales bacterium]
MDDSSLIEEFGSRSRSARNIRLAAAAALLLSAVGFALYGIPSARDAQWSGVLLAAAGVLAAAAFGLAVFSFTRLRCPNCERALWGAFQAAFCPSCGAALKAGAGSFHAARSTRKLEGRTAIVRRGSARTSARVWEPQVGLSGADDFPMESYPKNIRMFTTSDELELTKRYMRLIDKDDIRRSGPGAERREPPAGDLGPDGQVQRRSRWTSLSMETKIALAGGCMIAVVILFLLIAALQ